MADFKGASVPEKPCIDCEHDYCRCTAQYHAWLNRSLAKASADLAATDPRYRDEAYRND